MKLIIVSGLSGSGKSIALEALEDLGFYCIDNLPVDLLPAFSAQLEQARRHDYAHAAVGIDARNLVDSFEHFPQIVDSIRRQGFECEIFFLDAHDHTLLKRYSETRRRHPLSGPEVPLAEAINAERALMAPMAAAADWRIDTSRTNVHQLRDLIRERVGGAPADAMSVLLLSFGYKHGVPVDADFVFDVRCLPNPHWEPELRPFTGRDASVREFLERQADVTRMYEQIRDLLDVWLPCFAREGRSYMTIAFGCTGGQHRSVYLIERLAEHLRARWPTLLVRHRELA